MKFYLDEDLSPQIAERLRKRGIDAVSALEAGNIQLSDREQLVYAADAGRCLVTRNVRHFVLLAQEAIRRQQPHAGIIFCPPTIRGFETRAIVDALTRLAKQFPRGLGEYDVLYLPSRG
jgi:predicted nuclease of predicted toxin-antitoxin system